jgi:hypothetical protein
MSIDCAARFGFKRVPCDRPATVKLRGKWWCEMHADEMEQVYETEDEALQTYRDADEEFSA